MDVVGIAIATETFKLIAGRRPRGTAAAATAAAGPLTVHSLTLSRIRSSAETK